MCWKNLLVICLVLMGSMAHGLDARTHIERAVELIEQREFSLGRSYLAPALVHPRLSAGERSRAYYLRGYSFLAQNMPVSARKDFNRALEFNPDNAAVLVALGRLHFYGRGTDEDPELAFSLYSKAADLNYANGHFHVGHAYLMGQGVEKNVVQARESLALAAEEGIGYAMGSLAASYRQPHVADAQPQLALEWYKRAVEAGESSALLSIGYMYANGELGEADAQRALGYYQQAAERGVPSAWVNLAYAYLTGAGVPVDYERARSHYLKAAEYGELASFIGLGHIYEAGLGVAPDRAAAVSWYEKAAQQGDVEAQLRLGYLYMDKDSEQSMTQALRWLSQASRQGNPQAYNDHAWLLATTKFAQLRNGTLALDQARRAVEQEESPAYLDTLAAAYAELGNFEQAIQVQLQALALVTPDQPEMKSQLEARLARYEQSQPWRE